MDDFLIAPSAPLWRRFLGMGNIFSMDTKSLQGRLVVRPDGLAGSLPDGPKSGTSPIVQKIQ